MTTRQASQQVSLFIYRWKPKAGQPLPWEIKQKLSKPKGGRNKKGDFDNFHNRDYDFVSPSGEVFTGKGVRQFAQEHGLSESALLDVLNGRVHSCRGWTKAVGGRKLPVPPTYYFLSPTGVVHTTTNLSEFARRHSLCPIALSRISRCIIGIHRGWRHCTPDGQPIVPRDRKHRKFVLRSPNGEIVEGSNLKAFAEKHGLSRSCLMKVLDGTSKEHRGWTLPVTEVVEKPDNFQEKLPVTDNMTTTTPNLGKLFTSRTSRPATPEDIALLAPGDWISEKECPWSWQFKRCCQDMAIGVWEGKEFFVPHHLLMVCEMIEGQVLEKFFIKPEPKFKVGDRIQYKVDPPGLGCSGEILEINEKAQLITALMEDGVVHRVRIGILKHWQEPIKFNKGDRVTDTFPTSKGRKGTITKTSEQWSMVLWDDAKKPQRWRHLEKDDSWNPAHFGEVPYQIESDGQTTIFFDDSGEPPDPDDFENTEKYEEAWEKWNLLQECSLPAAGAVQKVRSQQDTNLSGQSKTTPTQHLSTENDFPARDSSSKTLPPLTTNLSSNSQPQTLLSAGVLAKISPSLAIAPGLKELAQACFLSSSDSWKSSSLRLYCGRTFFRSYLVEKGEISSKSLMRLQRWGMWGIGKLGTEADIPLRTENESSLWVFTADIRATTPKSTKKSLAEILGAIPINSATKEPINQAFTLRASSPKAGVGNESHPNTFVLQPAVLDIHHASGGRLYEEESPCLLSPCVGGRKFSVVYRAAGGDRIYHQQAPCLRSPNNAGNGAYKIREYQGETYLERPINATEAEQLMGWEVGSTAIGINGEGDEITISQTQRIKILGNGIISGEITDILTAIKPTLLNRLESEIPKHLHFAYRQLRQKGYAHQQAVSFLINSK